MSETIDIEATSCQERQRWLREQAPRRSLQDASQLANDSADLKPHKTTMTRMPSQ